MEKTDILVIGIVAFAVIISIFSVFYLFNLTGSVNTNQQSQQKVMPSSMSRMKLTSFDATLARKLMDADGDGKCDACGMDVELCMSSGQLQCNMDSKSTIGILGSAHIHADWKIYVNGKALDEEFFKPLAKAHVSAMRDPSIKATSSFMHVHEAPENPPEKVGDVLHMHATGVPLWIFFDSVGMEFNKDCISLPTEKFCNDGKKALKFYVNGQPNGQYEKYIFSDLDKILISYGDETDLSSQLDSITNFAKNH